jgi:hypothetical protein
MDIAPEVLRSIERLLVVLGGILAVYFGYRLFSVATIRQDAAGKLKTSIFEFSATKVGPGVFFALFGAWVLYSSLNAPVTIGDNTQMPQANPFTGGVGNNASELQQLRTYLAEIPDKDRREAALAILTKLATTRPIFYYGYQSPTAIPFQMSPEVKG